MKNIELNLDKFFSFGVFIESCSDIIFNRIIDFYNVWDNKIEENENSEHPETYEKDLRCNILRDVHIHLTSHPPIIDDHDVE